jgi:hypothetical protein
VVSALGGLERLSPEQRDRLDAWLPGAVVERDHSWGLVETVVLEVTHGGSRYIVKAAGPHDHHLARELRAHARWLEPWTRIGRAPVLVRADEGARLLVTEHLPGELVLGTPAADDPDVHRQAGELLALLHGQLAVLDETHEARENSRALAHPDRRHRIAPDLEERLRAEIAGWPTPPATLVPTHGDWQPRNWLVHEGVVSVIDLGRADLRPAMTDLTRVAAQDFARDPRLELAFLEGYGTDPREPAAWHRTRVREAVGTAVWAHEVGDEAFEAQGHRMIAEALRGSSRRRRPPSG